MGMGMGNVNFRKKSTLSVSVLAVQLGGGLSTCHDLSH